MRVISLGVKYSTIHLETGAQVDGNQAIIDIPETANNTTLLHAVRVHTNMMVHNINPSLAAKSCKIARVHGIRDI